MMALVVENHALRLENGLPVPEPRLGEVLVKVHYASVNPTDSDIVDGALDLYLKLARSYLPTRTGLEFSGEVVNDSNRFERGDLVYGYVDLFKGHKTHQQFLCVPETLIARAPRSTSLKEAAALPLGALTTLVGLREVAEIARGSSVLINGASGGLGVYAVQIAKRLGANVTAVAGPGKGELLRDLGADAVADYTTQQIGEYGGPFDLALDLSDRLSFTDVRSVLTTRGAFMPADPSKHLGRMLLNPFSAKKTLRLLVRQGDTDLLTEIARWVDEGGLRVFVDRSYELADYENAFARTREHGGIGRVVMRMAD